MITENNHCTLWVTIEYGRNKVCLFWINSSQGIEQLKKEEARWIRKSRWKSFHAVFGLFSIAWFSPFTQPPLDGKKRSAYLYAV